MTTDPTEQRAERARHPGPTNQTDRADQAAPECLVIVTDDPGTAPITLGPGDFHPPAELARLLADFAADPADPVTGWQRFGHRPDVAAHLAARADHPRAGEPHPPAPATAGEDGRDEPAAGRQAPAPEVVGLVCPECGEDAIERPPDTLVPYDAHQLPVPVYSHPDGEPLCPVPGPRGYQPADPVEVHAEHAPPAAPGPEVAPEVAHAHQAVTRALGDPHPLAPARAGEDARRDQLTRWRHDDERANAATAEHEPGDVLDDGTGPR